MPTRPDQVVLVTGCSTGIGRALARELLACGHQVYASARRLEAIADLESAGARTLKLDVTDPASVAAAVKALIDRAGRIDAVINNAGINHYGPVAEMPLDRRGGVPAHGGPPGRAHREHRQRGRRAPYTLGCPLLREQERGPHALRRAADGGQALRHRRRRGPARRSPVEHHRIGLARPRAISRRGSTSATTSPTGRSSSAAAAGRVAARALVQPRVLGGVVADVGRELVEVARGRSARAPEAGDKRWTDPAFQKNPLYRRLMQGYLAWRAGVQRLVDEVGLDPKSRERGRFVLSLVTEALAPTNSLAGNPAALKRAVDTRAKSLISGARHLAADLKDNGGLPAQVDRRPFRVGENLATTPGQVVFRSEVLELIQYQPAKSRVFERPIVFIPPQINKYYILDLAPSRSLIEFALHQGFQVFAVSWRNVTPAQRDWDFATYVQALKDATSAMLAITGAEQLNVIAACAGGITTSVLLGHLAALGDDRVSSATFMVTVLDTSVSSSVGNLVSEKSIASSLRRSQRRDVLSSADLGRAFALLRPNDLVWNYWVNNYLLGADPPAFDILYWNNDATNLPAALHADFLALYLEDHEEAPPRRDARGGAARRAPVSPHACRRRGAAHRGILAGADLMRTTEALDDPDRLSKRRVP